VKNYGGGISINEGGGLTCAVAFRDIPSQVRVKMVVMARFTAGQAGDPAIPQLLETRPPFIAVSGLLSLSVQELRGNSSVLHLTTVDCPALIGVGFTSNVRNLPVMVMGELVQVLGPSLVNPSFTVTDPFFWPLKVYTTSTGFPVRPPNGELPDQVKVYDPEPPVGNAVQRTVSSTTDAMAGTAVQVASRLTLTVVRRSADGAGPCSIITLAVERAE